MDKEHDQGIDERLLDLYDRELEHLRAMGTEFAKLSPNAAGRLNLAAFTPPDPYVERLLEGFAFLAARVQLRLDAEFPRFSERLLEICYPGFLAPTPSMLIARFEPTMAAQELVKGVPVLPGTQLKCEVPMRREAAGSASRVNRRQAQLDDVTCRFRTAHAVTLRPIEVSALRYLSHVAELRPARPPARAPRAGLRLRLRTHPDCATCLDGLGVDKLRLHLCDAESDDVAYRLYERLVGHTVAILVMPASGSGAWQAELPPQCLRAAGFDDEEALLPRTLQGFQGYRLLQEYFAFPQRFMFVDLVGLDSVLRHRDEREVDIVFLLDQGDPALEGVITAANVALHCTPAINLFEHACVPIELSNSTHHHHVLTDRTHASAYEVYDLREVRGLGPGAGNVRRFLPLYSASHPEHDRHDAYYCLEREPRRLAAQELHERPRSDYVGCEAYISLVDSKEAPYGGALRQLEVRAVCTNRDLPLDMVRGGTKTDLKIDIALPLQSVRVLTGPTKPTSRLQAARRLSTMAPGFTENGAEQAGGASSRMRDATMTWRLLNHLTLNHLSLSDTNEAQGAAALRELLCLYAVTADTEVARQQIEGLRHVRLQRTVRRLPAEADESARQQRSGRGTQGRIVFGRVVQVEVEVDDTSFQGLSAFLLGQVLSRFFARYATLNTWTETVVKSLQRGTIMSWDLQCGSQVTL